MDRPFIAEELERAVNSVRVNSAPGRDQIDYIMIKNLNQKFKEELLTLFNWIYENGRLFEDWKDYQTIFIDKGNKEKVRPIALSSCMSKILERMVNDRLVWWAENNNKLDKNQNGFRKGRSCIDNLVKLNTQVEIGILEGQHTIAAFFRRVVGL
ncbi:rna-directed dna polymerase from mobile element jockey-like protein [Lasius niger]|uniref:Rna-directed dna polymerase from mobile element jockey-like protein n=1 Tax=Lasius niger TaxID=67767 RepID=A0A0J7NE63_LASNI|nr:rna-directed dna polymerase from mobile element jockey-like protein [Lasius niger]